MHDTASHGTNVPPATRFASYVSGELVAIGWVVQYVCTVLMRSKKERGGVFRPGIWRSGWVRPVGKLWLVSQPIL